jgi:hypothetical protein
MTALPFFEEQGIPLLRMLTDRGSEYCGSIEHHEYQLYLALEDIDHSKIKARHPQSNGAVTLNLENIYALGVAEGSQELEHL